MNDKKDRQLMVLSIIVAIIMRAYVMTSTNPSLTKTIRNVPLTIRNLQEVQNKDFTIVDRDQIGTVNVKLEGARDQMVGLNADDILASVNLEAPGEGIRSLKVQVDTPAGIRVEEVDPKQINLKIEKIIEKKLPISLFVEDNLKEGRIVEVNELYPSEVTIKGSRSAIDKVTRLQVNIDKESYLNGKIHNVAIVALDANKEKVDGIDFSTDEVSVSYQVSETKQVPIKFVTKGNLPAGYKEAAKTTTPSSLIIKGENQIISKVKEIETEALQISNLKKDTTGEIKLILPEGVEIYDGDDRVNYRIKIEKEEKEEKEEKDEKEEENGN
jgi:YbbR domain-containing protein